MGRGVALATNHQHKTFKYLNQNFGTGHASLLRPVASFALLLGFGMGEEWERDPFCKTLSTVIKVRKVYSACKAEV